MEKEPSLARDLPDALRLLARSRISGTVRVRSDDAEACLTVGDGKILFASSTRTPQLGRVLVDRGLVSAETLAGALRLQEKRGHAQPIGTLLYELGLLGGKAADEQIAMHVANVVREAVSWVYGTFTFEAQDVPLDGVLASELLAVERILTQVRLLDGLA